MAPIGRACAAYPHADGNYAQTYASIQWIEWDSGDGARLTSFVLVRSTCVFFPPGSVGEAFTISRPLLPLRAVVRERYPLREMISCQPRMVADELGKRGFFRSASDLLPGEVAGRKPQFD